MEQVLLDRPWSQVHEALQVKLLEKGARCMVVACSEDLRHKQRAIRRRELKRLVPRIKRFRA